MRKYFYISGLTTIGLVFIILIYISTYGIKTDRFNTYINEKVKELDSKISLNLNEVYLKLNLKERSIEIKTENTKIYIENNEIILSEVNISLDLIKYINDERAIKKIKLETEENSIKSITNFLNSYKFNIPRFIIFNQIKSGNIKLTANIFNNKENEKDYVFKTLKFSSNIDELSKIRRNLRQKALQSPVFDAPRFTKHFSKMLWDMWNNFCKHCISFELEFFDMDKIFFVVCQFALLFQ